jgi:NAD(P)-dependent dehydrogenase (short-subunit alcohol dehydrogenase family)
MNRLAGKVTMVTGAGRGIGAAIALAFAREGASVALAELDIDTARATAERIASEVSGARVLAVQTDVTQSAQVKEAVAHIEASLGPLDVLVNNAGINVFCDPLTMTDDDWRRCFAVDLDGVWNGCRAVLPGMVGRGRGSIVNIASTHAFKIAPGYIETQLTVDWWDSQADPKVARQATLDLQPMKRIGQPHEVAMTAVFLASDEAPFINASCITVDGGRSALYHD